MNSKIAFVELGGASLEISKNLVLKALNLDIFDSRKLKEEDLDELFLFGDDDLGKSR